MSITWTSSSSGTYDLIVVGTSGVFSGPPGPSDGHYLTPNTVYASGAPMLNNGFAYGYGYSVYSSTGTSVNITGLAPARNYVARVYAYNRVSSDSTCNYSSSSSISFSTYNTPPTLSSIGNTSHCAAFTNKSYSVALSGIGTGGESQTLSFSGTTSDNTLLVYDSVDYVQGQTTGTLYYHVVTISIKKSII